MRCRTDIVPPRQPHSLEPALVSPGVGDDTSGREYESQGEDHASERSEIGPPARRPLQGRAGRSRAVHRDRERHRRPGNADRVAIADDDHEPADDVVRPTDDEQSADRREGDAQDGDTDQRRVPNPNVLSITGDRIDHAEDERCDRAPGRSASGSVITARRTRSGSSGTWRDLRA